MYPDIGFAWFSSIPISKYRFDRVAMLLFLYEEVLLKSIIFLNNSLPHKISGPYIQ
jgi:hypothetical protein